jgi:asparagine synthase (glutamine-hydrolysing)
LIAEPALDKSVILFLIRILIVNHVAEAWMSGIAVFYNLDGRPVDRMLLDRMLGAIGHRGPDGIGRWIEGPIALGHAMLRTTPESLQEFQPLRDEKAGLCLTLDGRVDNRDELADALNAKGFDLRTNTDAEIVLRAYECWGEESPHQIIGDFAFALWDERRRRLFCARDLEGIKPFFYYFDGRIFICGSELRQIVEMPMVPGEPNEAFIGEYLCGRLIDREETLYKSVSRLAAGSSLTVSSEGLSKRSYYSLDPKREIRYQTDDQYASHLRQLLRQVVRSSMRSIGGVAVELSGGLDSSTVACIANSLLRDRAGDCRMETFSLVYSDPECDEREYIDAVVQQWGLTSNLIEPGLDKSSSFAALARLHRDLPGFPNGVVFEDLRHLIAEKGFRVSLTGAGGDQWFTGSAFYYADLVRELKFGELWRDLRVNWRFGPPSSGRLENLLRYGAWPLVPDPARRVIKRLRGNPEFPPWLSSEFAHRVNLAERLRHQAKIPAGLTFAQRTMYETFQSGWDTYLYELEDRDSARYGIEQRYPLDDRRLLEFAFSIPESQRFRGRETKFVMRQAMKALLPEKVSARLDKSDFTGMAVTMLQKLGGEQLFKSLTVASCGWVDGKAIRAMWSDDLSVLSGSALWALWKILNIEVWMNEGLRSNPSASAEVT